MDHPLTVVADEGELSWSDNHSMDSDDGHPLGIPHSSPWLDAISTTSATASISSIASQMTHGAQISPISTAIDIPGATVDGHVCHSAASHSSTAPTMIHSASSSCTDSWSIGYGDADEMPGRFEDNEMHWDQDSDDVLTVPKLEPLEDDFSLDDVKEAPMTPVASSNAPTPAVSKIKRPRGRPRKNPPSSSANNSKVTKGRSKTGCITCRKRKKKCDEAKPRCMNCEKNAVVCEGYPEKQIWKSGKEKAEEGSYLHITDTTLPMSDPIVERLKVETLPMITLQPIFSGLETPEDMIFWKHYNEHLSAVLTVEGQHKNAFNDMLVPVATKHQGLMHSILALSSKHLDYDAPYAVNFLKKYPNITLDTLHQRAEYHHEKAIEKLYADMNRQENKDDPQHNTVLSARYGQILCLLLESVAEGNPRGEHRIHLEAYQNLIRHSPPEDPAFASFISEFFQYHIFADELIRYPDLHSKRLASEDWRADSTMRPPRLIGVADGLFRYLCQITSIRNQIRLNMAAHIDPVVDYTSLYRAAEIDAAIRDWNPHWPPGDSRDRVGLLYKQMMWVYLLRTIYPPLHSPSSSATSSAATLMTMPVSAPTTVGTLAPLANTPPRSASPSCASSPSPKMEALNKEDLRLRRHSIANPKPFVTQGFYSNRAESPPPVRQPPNHDPRITLAVEESLTILDSFKPSDPVQTLLLVPCLVIGTACFAPSQQERVRAAVRTVRGYTGLRNTDRVAQLLEEVWRLMERGDWARVWDWQGVAKSMGVDFLCT